MDAATKDRIQINIFVGFALKINYKIALNNNSLWKEASVSKTTSLRQITHEDKSYIGFYIRHEAVTLKDLQNAASQARDEFQKFCIGEDVSKCKAQIFPQVFVS